MNMSKLMDIIFICSFIIFNISVSALYIATKLGNMVLVQVCGAIVLSLIIPFTITLLGYTKEKPEKRVIISHAFILFYLFLELSLDYILKIPFREILAIHVLYIIVFYAAMFSMIGVSFSKNRKMGFVVIITFLILIGCLVYYLLPF
ncbi:MAG: hypothetical protein OEY24_07675 [Candidatus Bathyarchaeota archaeon]|nr:hypothetical protein [Candidatus Bathyarchaeota archaeon]MDH5495559.1 hypothetical protein [Candidatus Bathyarchaeota archaeon]